MFHSPSAFCPAALNHKTSLVTVCVCLVAQSRPVLCGPTDCSPPGPSVHGTSQAEETEGQTSSGCTDVIVFKAHLIISQRYHVMLRVYTDRNTKNTSFWYAKSLQSCPAICDPMDCSPPGPSVHGISQARILEWVAISSS